MSKILRISAALLAMCLLLLSLPGCSQNKEVIARVGEYELYYEYLRFATLNFKLEMDKTYGDDDDTNGTIWDDPETAAKYKPLLEEKVWGLLTDNFAVLLACEKYGIGRDVMEGKTVQSAVDANMKDLRNQYSSYAAYEEAIEESFMNEDVFRFYFGIEEMKKQLLEAMKRENEVLTDQEKFVTWLEKGNYVYVQHVARFIGENDSVELHRDMMDKVYEGLTAEDENERQEIDFYINSVFNQDTSNTAPYYMVRGVHDDKLMDAALLLEEVGDVTPVIEVEDALYILVRMEEEEDTLGNQIPTLFSLYQWSIVGDRVEEIKKELQFEKTEFGKNLDILTIQ